MKWRAVVDRDSQPPWRIILLLSIGYGILGGTVGYGGFVPKEEVLNFSDPDIQANLLEGFATSPHVMFVNTIITYGISQKAALLVPLASRESLLLKLKITFKEADQTLQVFLNGHLIESVRSQEPSVAHKFYLKVPSSYTQAGLNQLAFINENPTAVYMPEEAIFRNFWAAGKVGLGVVLPRDATFLSSPRPRMGLGWIFFRSAVVFLILVCAWICGVSATQALTPFRWTTASGLNRASLVLPFFVFSGIGICNAFTPYVILASNKTLLLGGLCLLAAFNGVLAVVRFLIQGETWLMDQYIRSYGYLLRRMRLRRILWRLVTLLRPRFLWKLAWRVISKALLYGGMALFPIYLLFPWQRPAQVLVLRGLRLFSVCMTAAVLPLWLGWRSGAEQLGDAAFFFLAVALLVSLLDIGRRAGLSDREPAIAESPSAPGATNRHLRYLADFEDGLPDVFHRIVYQYAQPHLRDSRSLNVGCWTGGFEAVAESSGHRLVGVDIEPKALQVVRRVAPRVPVLCAQAQRLPFQDESFDTVTLFTVLEHLPAGKEAEVLTELCRVLKTGGVLILTTPRLHWLGNISDVAWWLAGHRHYRVEQVRDLLTTSGFDVVRSDLRGRWFSTLTIPLFYVWKYLLRRNFYRLSFVERRLQQEYAQPGFRDIFVVGRKRATGAAPLTQPAKPIPATHAIS